MHNPRQRARAWLRSHGQIPLYLVTLLIAALFAHLSPAPSPSDMPTGAAETIDITADRDVPASLAMGRRHIVAVDAGHGGEDGGAIGRFTKTPEKGLNLAVAQELEALLSRAGVTVVMTREQDVMLCDPATRTIKQRKKEDMVRRGEIVRAANADVVVSVHMNEYTASSAHGAQVFFQKGDEVSMALAKTVQTSMLGLDESNKRQALAGDFYMLRQGPPSVLVECGFLSNRQEEALLCTPAHQKRVARCIFDGVMAYLALEDGSVHDIIQSDDP